MQVNIRKILGLIICSFILCACGSKNINNGQKSQHSNVKPVTETIFVENSTRENIQSELNNANHKDVHYLSNKAIFFEDFLFVNSVNTDIIFSDKDENGNYHSWQHLKDLIPGSYLTTRQFKYNNQLVIVSQIAGGYSEIITFNSDFEVIERNKIEVLIPKFLYGNTLYGYSYNKELLTIKTINLDSLEEAVIHSSGHEMRPDFIINNSGELIICKQNDIAKTCFYKYSEGMLTPIFESRNSSLIFYDSRGIFYLEESISSKNSNLMLWNGSNSRLIGEIKTEDMGNWEANNGFMGLIHIEDDFYVTVHTRPLEPYLLIHPFNSKETLKVPLKKWPFSEADMSRFGETFSGIYYEDGKAVDFFFSNKAGMLQTETIDLREIYRKEMAAIEEGE